MNFLTRLIFILFFSSLLQSCPKDEKDIPFIQEVNQEQEMISAYMEGIKSLDEGDPFFAAK